jgi:hypothetical protein
VTHLDDNELFKRVEVLSLNDRVPGKEVQKMERTSAFCINSFLRAIEYLIYQPNIKDKEVGTQMDPSLNNDYSAACPIGPIS